MAGRSRSVWCTDSCDFHGRKIVADSWSVNDPECSQYHLAVAGGCAAKIDLQTSGAPTPLSRGGTDCVQVRKNEPAVKSHPRICRTMPSHEVSRQRDLRIQGFLRRERGHTSHRVFHRCLPEAYREPTVLSRDLAQLPR